MSFSFSIPLLSTPTPSLSTTSPNTTKPTASTSEQLYSISQAVQGVKSFEEVRIDDYLLSYSTTGRPPPPCPQEPKDPALRATQGLPPLFEPTVDTKTVEIPESQWQLMDSGPFESPEGTLWSITAGGERSSWSFEELRVQAYRKGNIHPPPTAKLIPFSGGDTQTANGIQYGGDTKETFMSISAKPEWAGHSFEELRVAYLRSGREITSKEIMGSLPGVGLR
ncbi:hypothetical protein VNI00_009596 [Paramarasmius palmivorus]|uniref:Uncharacterized protein n=1 Tax=Paramarasmius palmivorus TaxID=297713 RepID=A0AAW0CLR7_9AGAR